MPIAQSQWCGYRVIGIPVDHILNIWPSKEWPHGREAQAISDYWYAVSLIDMAGLLLVGCDVAADLDDIQAMTDAVAERPGDVHTGLVKLWPASTGRDDWIWSHRGGTLGSPTATQDETAPVTYFSIGFAWLPARLLNLACPGMESWRWGETDVKLSELALNEGIPAHVVPGCRPKHLHFQREHDGNVIRERAAQARRQ